MYHTCKDMLLTVFECTCRHHLPYYTQWWMSLRGLMRILAHHETMFEHTEAKLLHICDVEAHDHFTV